MGFSGHVIVSRADLTGIFPDSEPIDVAAGLRGLRVFDGLNIEWDSIQEHDRLLTEHASGGFLSASVYDSDGALLTIGVPGHAVGSAWLHLADAVGHFFPPWSPFDEEGQMLSPAEVAGQDAEWEVEAAEYKAEMANYALDPHDAAVLCIELAATFGVQPEHADVISEKLSNKNVFVEETIDGLLAALGMLQRT